ncbi:DEAD/DEAH box helicase [Streptomyces sp. NPDC058280]|uniref:DEAD/DEAH box helicase n=1 Tax=Streptomyces sp. NPDC058280 TaxID=3346419 RepID=UPI0036ED2D24
MSEPSAAFTPRPYQTAAIQALTAGWQGEQNRLAVVLPTGAGKTVVFANLIKGMREQLGRQRVLVIAHREELIEQAVAKIRAVDPSLKVGVVKAERNHHRFMDVVVASVQTLAVQRRREAIQDIGLIIVDECHHAAAKTYVKVLDHFGAWRGVPVAGFTATMTRGDGDLGSVWQDVVYTLDILDMIRDGYLCDVIGKRVVVDGLNLDTVKTRGGDLQDGQLAQALDDSGAAGVVADAYREFAADRPGVVFTPTVATAQSMTAALSAAGIPAATVWGDMPKDERTQVLKQYQAGDVQVLSNCMVLAEGFDAPHTSCVVIARPTKSAGLYCQMAGRGLRLHPGKKDALLLDVMGASTRHKLASIVDLTAKDIAEESESRSLRELADDAAQAAAFAAAEWEDIDLFHQSPIRWLQTDGGTWFVPMTKSVFLFLMRGSEPGLYRVRRWDAGTGVRPPQPDPEAPLAEAMRWTEEQARRLVKPGYLRRDASYRTNPPSSAQRSWCRFKRVTIPPGSTAGDVSDLMDIYTASLALRGYRTVRRAA